MTKGVIFFAEHIQQSLWGDILGWKNTLKKMGVDFYYAIDTTGDIIATDQTYRCTSFNEALTRLATEHPECETVWFKIGASVELKDFEHPANACYIFGQDSGTTIYTTANHEVKLYAENLWAIECCCIALYDRLYSEIP